MKESSELSFREFSKSLWVCQEATSKEVTEVLGVEVL
jgi:hypothetical protein